MLSLQFVYTLFYGPVLQVLPPGSQSSRCLICVRGNQAVFLSSFMVIGMSEGAQNPHLWFQ